MMMDKYGRSPYRRTTSMTGITVVGLDYTTDMAAPPPPPPGVGAGEYEHMYNMLSPRYNSSYVVETADFLRSCGLCNCRLAPGRDIYMYRGDAAFCSLECREHQMNLDERQERREAAAAKKGNNRRGEGVAVAPKATAKSGATATA